MTIRTPETRICLWYNHDAEEAAAFYSRTFPGSAVGAVHKRRPITPTAGRVMCW